MVTFYLLCKSMAYHYDQNTGELIIDGFETGIAASPFKGMGDIKSGNITTLPGQISISYNRLLQSQSKTITNSLSGSTTSTLSYSGGSQLLHGTWILIVSSTITNLTPTQYYYILSNSGGSPANITLALDYEGAVITNFGVTGSAQFSVVPMGQPIAWASDNSSSFPSFSYYILDANGRVWKNPPGASSSTTGLGIWSLIDYTPVSGAGPLNGLFIYGAYVFVVSNGLYYKGTGTVAHLGHATAWVKWMPTGVASYTQGVYHYSLVNINSLVVICNGSQIDTFSVVPGTAPSGFDPTNAATYTYTPAAVLLPYLDEATVLAQIVVSGGTNIVIGGLMNALYFWQPGSSSAAFTPLYLAENFTQNLVTVNNLVYVFAGSKGNIYITNGSSITTAMTVPDYVANSTGSNQDPFYVWGGAMYLRGRIWFSVKAPNCGGIWSFTPTINYFPEQDVGLALRLENQNSYGTYAGFATILIPSQASTDQQANGAQYYAGWDDGTAGASSNPYGIDFSDTIPAVNGAIIETDAIPTGTFLRKDTFKKIEYKLATAPLSVTTTTLLSKGATSAVLSIAWAGRTISQYIQFSDGEIKQVLLTNGSTAVSWAGGLLNTVNALIYLEMVVINYRTDLNAAWISPTGLLNFENSSISGYYPVDFEKTQWLQLQIILRSTPFTPTFTPLKELRIK